MNKLHFIAKVAFGMLGIYLIISVIASVMTFVLMAVQGYQTFHGWVLFSVIAYGVVLFGYLCLLYFLLFRRADIFARKIVGPADSPEPENPGGWYPFALRLTMIAAGFLFLGRSISMLGRATHMFQVMFRAENLSGINQAYEYGIYFLLYFFISIYLLCGAPHFVRWHIRKTRRLYMGHF